MSRPPSAPRLQYMVASPARPRRDVDSDAYAHVLSDADRRLQEIEAQRILDKVRIQARAHKKSWGTSASQERDDAVRRSLSRPLLTPTNQVAKLMTAEQRKEAHDSIGFAESAALAPLPERRISSASAASPLRPTLAPRARPTSAAARPPVVARVPPVLSASSHIAKLEKEVGHLKDTIGVLLETQPSGSSSRPSVAPHPPRREKFADVVQEHAGHMSALEDVLEERKEAEERVLHLERERRRIGAAAARLDADMERRSRGSSPHEGEGRGGDRERVEDTLVGTVSSVPHATTTTTTSSSSKEADAVASGEVAHKRSRPVSAQGRMEGVTRTATFSFMAPPGSGTKESISKRRAEEEKRKRDAELDAVLHYSFVAGPVPESTRIPLFGMIMSRMETKRKLKHEARFAEHKASTKPFQMLEQHEGQMRARIAASRARTELLTQREISEGTKFRAVPIPDTIQNPDSEYVELVRREKERPQRIASGARALAAGASLPPRMALAQETEKRRRAEREAREHAEAAAAARLARFHSNHMPDFSHLHGTFSESLRETRKHSALTTVVPFDFDSEARKAAEAARKAALVKEQELATSRSMELRAHSRSQSARGGTGGDLNGTLRSTASMFAPDASGRLGAADTSLGGGEEDGGYNPSRRGRSKSIAECLSASHAPPAAMTRAVKLRMLEVQRRVRERQERERALAVEEEARVAKVKAATRAVAPLVQQLERQRNPIPLAWQEGATATAATAAKEAFEKQARINAQNNREHVAAAERTRPLLFMRSSMDITLEEARRSAIVSAAKAVGRPHNASWQQTVEHGVEGVDMFDDEDRVFLGLDATKDSR